MPSNPFREFERKEEALKWAKEAFLTKCGWKSTCSTPGAYWMHEKTLPDGRVLLATTNHALSIEERIWVTRS